MSSSPSLPDIYRSKTIQARANWRVDEAQVLKYAQVYLSIPTVPFPRGWGRDGERPDFSCHLAELAAISSPVSYVENISLYRLVALRTMD
jgi:hypothetical protein